MTECRAHEHRMSRLSTLAKHASLLAIVFLTACGGESDDDPGGLQQALTDYPCNKPALVVTVRTATGANLAGATVEVYLHSALDPKTTPLSGFPFDGFDVAPTLTGTTDAQGNVTVPASVFGGTSSALRYTFVARKPGYLARAVSNIGCWSLAAQTLTLTPISGYQTQLSADAPLSPARVEISSLGNGAFIERAGRMVRLAVKPFLRKDILATAASVDVTMTIVRQSTSNGFRKWVVSANAADPDFSLSVAKSGAKMGRMTSFAFTLPEGLFYFYFTFHVKTTTGGQSEYQVYPNWIWSAPPLLAETLAALGLDGMSSNTFTAAILVFPSDSYGDWNQFKAVLSHPTPDARPMVNQKLNKTAMDMITDKPLSEPISATKINVVFLTSGFADKAQPVLAQMLNDATLGFLNVEPYRSNRHRFAFWYHPSDLTAKQIDYPYDFMYKFLTGAIELTQAQQIYLSHTFSGKTLMVALIKDQSLSDGVITKAGSGKCTFIKGVELRVNAAEFDACLSTKDAASCTTEFSMPRVLLHEMGHELGWLAEEYVSEPQTLFDIAEFVKTQHADYSPHFRPNTHFPSGYSAPEACIQLKNSVQNLPSDQIVCAPHSSLSCENSPWRDYIGNGCGKDGVVDCGPDDPNYHLEVSCRFGGGPAGQQGFPNLVKPTRASVMSFRSELSWVLDKIDPARVYGPVNERELCRAIVAFTGAADGICKTHCLESCNASERCVSGVCQPQAF